MCPDPFLPLPGFVYFPAESCLYTDHMGRRVVADWDGAGAFSIFGSSEFSGESDGVFWSGRSGSFSDWVTAWGPPGEGGVLVRTGSAAPDSGFESFSGEFFGAGWAVGAPGLILDCRPVHPDLHGLSLPFLWSAVGESFLIWRSNWQLELLQTFTIDAPSSTWRVQNMSRVEQIEGEPCASHLNRAHWSVDIPLGTASLVLVKRADQFHGRQRARVLIDGVAAGVWSASWQNRDVRLGRSHFVVAGSHYVEGRLATITIDPPAGAPLWSISRIEVWGLITKSGSNPTS